MLLLQSSSNEVPEVWSARAAIPAEPADVLRALTDPERIAAWAPVSFELEESCGRALCAGSRESVSGSIAGLRVSFEVHVARADTTRLELEAQGPISLDVAYRFREQDGYVLVDASVGLRRRGGLTAQVLRAAVAAVLGAGALEKALARLQSSLAERSAPALAAA